ncbi:hypothetical protein GUJ93_ZPchr0003g16466 [Zizania palustris]|uniref:Uncharacterized protein n=1 Tax=Zizania palustris TaxID=103762 RepID=A0A8J5RKP2_ZIZPA|nr:hypothetical protein GUJ93_ZPchr0003g16466 [Zizania palustris]
MGSVDLCRRNFLPATDRRGFLAGGAIAVTELQFTVAGDGQIRRLCSHGFASASLPERLESLEHYASEEKPTSGGSPAAASNAVRRRARAEALVSCDAPF